MTNTLLIAHDAGAAELLCHYAGMMTGHDLAGVFEGPAQRIFADTAFPRVEFEGGLAWADTIVTGSSWGSTLEWRALREARKARKPSTTVLDHWVNYRERLIREGQLALPDTLWVADADAEQIARKVFPDIPVVNRGNPYLAAIAKRAAARRPALRQEPRVLLVTEPTSVHAELVHGDPRYFGYTEIEAVTFALKSLPTLLRGDRPESVVVRPHPSEPEGKYLGVLHAFPELPVQVSKTDPLIEVLLRSDIVIGCETMAMVAALAAGCRVVSCIPKTGAPCTLPQREIEHLRDMV